MTAPFAHLRVAVACAVVFAAATLVWAVAGAALPGGRWLAVHLFTLGVVSNLIAALAVHFAETVGHAARAPGATGRLLLLNAGAVTLLAGLPAGARWAVAGGATAMTAAVLWLYLALRRMRRASLAGRFAFVIRSYERAAGAFVHGALLGALMGLGVLGGSWYGAARLAHLHVNVLGWGGLTLLATLVFFGPTVLRTRMEPRADRVAAPALRHGATALTVAVLALLLTGAGGPVGTAGRIVTVAGLAVFAGAGTAICRPVLKAARRGRRSAGGLSLAASCVWLPLALWADVAIVASGRLELLDTLGAVALAGVLGQAVLGALSYLAPMVWAAGSEQRTVLRERLDRLPRARAAAFNAGVVAVALGAAPAPVPPGVATAGWLAVAGATAAPLALAAATPRGGPRARAGRRGRRRPRRAGRPAAW